ncbi:alkaline phosphatase [Bacillus mycoides]|uniref:BREX-1 system phosphatase PglZ type A n=1 Tax=Bacillus mycoides TaxID=1405 RepID=UPI0018CF7167|nr:BREX-1 system phosphatase PglZ type A [Bacillus mycoides]MBG9596517.1 alkaline phosphatase [Bacillus mycoides]
MNKGQIESALNEIFQQPLKVGEQRKLVFWADTDKAFAENYQDLNLGEVKVHTLTEKNLFYTKYLLEEEDPASSYLIYTNQELGVEENWLADTVLYSTIFYADRISLIMNDFGIDASLRSKVKEYEKFFGQKVRYRKFKELEIGEFTEESLQLTILSVLVNVKTPDFELILKTILLDTLQDEDNKYLIDIEKFFNIDVFWQFIEKFYGYDRTEKSLKTLFMHLTMTAFSAGIEDKYLTTLDSYISKRSKMNSVVFIDHWMHHKTDYNVFNDYAEVIEQEIQLSRILQQMDVNIFKQSEIFPYVDKAIIIYITNSLLANLEDYEEYLKLVKLRRAKHYYEKYEAIYEALYYTVKMVEFRKQYSNGLPHGTAVDLFKRYVDEYSQMDMFYRKFYVTYDQESDNEILKKLRELVENVYTNWFIGDLSVYWTQSVKHEMAATWSLPNIQSQQKFYRTYIQPHVSNNERVFVIISDAMRYEVGQELAEQLNAATLGTCEIESMLGVVPSVTKLGMAALLPHLKLEMTDSAEVLINGKSTSGMDKREKILQFYVEDSSAVYFQDIFNMNKAGRREAFKGKKLVYIYHDTIDAMGDKANTELYTFKAVEDSLAQLFDLVKILRDDLSATNIYITADHGFIYQREALADSDKIERERLETVEMKRRYMLAKEQREVEGQLAINLDSVVENISNLHLYSPNGVIRNRIQGAGVNFVHGGASLQEVTVPVIIFKNKRVGQKGVRTIQKVDVRLTSVIQKITNAIFKLEFFQTEKVEDKKIARTVVTYVATEDGTILSNEHTIIGDRTSDKPEERTFKLSFTLKQTTKYDKNKTYYLIVKDIETDVIVERVPVLISLGFVSDFDF